MATSPHRSPAVESLKRERAAARAGARQADLDKDLEDTFPASDPVSRTSTGVPTGHTDRDEAEKVSRS